MKHSMLDPVKKVSCLGPGGINCPCCRPVGGDKKNPRKFINRTIRRKDRAELGKVVQTVEDEDESPRTDPNIKYLRKQLSDAESCLEAASSAEPFDWDQYNWAHSEFEQRLHELGEAEYRAAQVEV